MPNERPNCAYCLKPADGPMLVMGQRMAHVHCAIRKLNELLDPYYEGEGEPDEIVRMRMLGNILKISIEIIGR